MPMDFATIMVNDKTGKTKNFQRHYDLESAEQIAKTYAEKGWTYMVFRLEVMYAYIYPPAVPLHTQGKKS